MEEGDVAWPIACSCKVRGALLHEFQYCLDWDARSNGVAVQESLEVVGEGSAVDDQAAERLRWLGTDRVGT